MELMEREPAVAEHSDVLKLLWQESMTADLGLAPRISVECCMEGSRKH